MFSQYRAAYTPEGAAAFSVAAFISRFSIAIYPIALVLMVSARTGDYGFSGLVSGIFVLGEALGNPLAGILVDRFSQHRVLPVYLIAHISAVTLMGLFLQLNTPLWTLLLPSVLMGMSLLNVGALVRARWSNVWPAGTTERVTAYSVESTLDEVIFVFGPLVATVLATHASPILTLLFAVGLIAAGSSWLASQRLTEPPVRVHPVGQQRASALANRGMANIIAVMACLGAVFGSAEVTIVAYCGQHGQQAHSGFVLAAFAFGSGLAGLIYGSRNWQASPLRRFVVSASLFGLLPVLYFAATGVRSLALCTAIIGLGIAPTLIGGFGLVDSIVPAASLTEGLTWIGTGLSVGFGIGASVVGGIADQHGARVAFLVPSGCALLAAICALTLAHRLRPQPVSEPNGRRSVVPA
jgi:MFS family permease